MRPSSSLALLPSALLLLAFGLIVPARAQEFTPIADGYQCARFADGHQAIARQIPGGFEILKTASVRRRYAREARIIPNRLAVLQAQLAKFQAGRVGKSKILRTSNKLLTKLFKDSAIPATVPESDLEIAVQHLVARLQNRLQILETTLQLIDDCAAGVDPNDAKGTVVAPQIDVVSIATSREIYGGYVVSTLPQLVQFSTQPGGYNACIKIQFAGENTVRHFIGMSDEGRCGNGTLIFEGVPPVTCDALIPAGHVGYVIPRRQYGYVTLPDATTEQLLDQMRLELVPQTPVVSLLAFLRNTSRDDMIAQCDAF